MASDDATDFTCFADPNPIRPLGPEAALRYFLSLVPKIGVKDPGRWGDTHRRVAFTLAEATDEALLKKVQQILGDYLKGGDGDEEPLDPAKHIDYILGQAGVTPRNPQYAEMVFRTNMMDAYNEGATEEMQDPDVVETFPVWRWLGIRDGRQRPSHEVHFDKYFPAGVSFAEVRDSVKGEYDGHNDRCTPQPIDKWTWEDLQKRGVRVSRFAECLHVPRVRQSTSYSCGAAALMAVGKYFGVGFSTEADYCRLLGTDPEDGTPPDAMVAGAQSLGLEAVGREGMTFEQIDRALIRGRPVVVCLQAYGSPEEFRRDEAGHWAVILGYDSGRYFFEDPAQEKKETGWLPRGEFLRRWHDRDGVGRRYVRYGIVVSRAGR